MTVKESNKHLHTAVEMITILLYVYLWLIKCSPSVHDLHLSCLQSLPHRKGESQWAACFSGNTHSQTITKVMITTSKNSIFRCSYLNSWHLRRAGGGFLFGFFFYFGFFVGCCCCGFLLGFVVVVSFCFGFCLLGGFGEFCFFVCLMGFSFYFPSLVFLCVSLLPVFLLVWLSVGENCTSWQSKLHLMHEICGMQRKVITCHW